MVSLILCALLAQATPAPPLLADGVRQVQEGDFETAVVTLRAVAASLAGDPARSVERARAHLYLGVAHVALDQADDAHRAFAEALRDDPRLRLTEDRYSPKVIAAFEAARREQPGASVASTRPKGGGSTKKVVVGAIAGAAVATGAVIALGGIVVSKSMRAAGDAMDQAVITYARQVHNMLIGERTAELVKIQAGSAFPLDEEGVIDIRGRDLATGR